MIIILKVREIDLSNQELVVNLYRVSFPHKERDSIHKFLNHDGKDGNIHVFYDEDKFVGFACIIKHNNILNIMYLAILSSMQGKGYGHEALELIKRMYPHFVITADIEKVEEQCVNLQTRKKRELFYLHDDFKETDIEYTYRNVDYILLAANGNISKREFKEFWTHFSHIDDLGHYIKNYYKVD